MKTDEEGRKYTKDGSQGRGASPGKKKQDPPQAWSALSSLPHGVAPVKLRSPNRNSCCEYAGGYPNSRAARLHSLGTVLASLGCEQAGLKRAWVEPRARRRSSVARTVESHRVTLPQSDERLLVNESAVRHPDRVLSGLSTLSKGIHIHM